MGGITAARLVPTAVFGFEYTPRINNNGTIRTFAPPPINPLRIPVIDPIIIKAKTFSYINK
jgi:hypothetical protein